MVVRGKGEGGKGGSKRRAPRKLQQGRVSTKAVGLRESSRNAVAICPAKSLSTRQLKDNRGGRRLLRPPTHTEAKYHQPHRAVTHQERGATEPPERALVDLFGFHQRRPLEEPTT